MPTAWRRCRRHWNSRNLVAGMSRLSCTNWRAFQFAQNNEAQTHRCSLRLVMAALALIRETSRVDDLDASTLARRVPALRVCPGESRQLVLPVRPRKTHVLRPDPIIRESPVGFSFAAARSSDANPGSHRGRACRAPHGVPGRALRSARPTQETRLPRGPARDASRISQCTAVGLRILIVVGDFTRPIRHRGDL